MIIHEWIEEASLIFSFPSLQFYRNLYFSRKITFLPPLQHSNSKLLARSDPRKMWKIWQTSYLACVSCVDKLNVLLLYLSSARFKSCPLLRTFCPSAAKTKCILQQDENIFSELFCQLVTCNWNASTLRAHSKSEISCILVRFPNLY